MQVNLKKKETKIAGIDYEILHYCRWYIENGVLYLIFEEDDYNMVGIMYALDNLERGLRSQNLLANENVIKLSFGKKEGDENEIFMRAHIALKV
ncbi:MAG: hypothetical protein GF349_00995 [Candidatus Magasanikbacteria bacterium]|nr:hypothetical protein [Candidatus Magasanikbacteria bacterium]